MFRLSCHQLHSLDNISNIRSRNIDLEVVKSNAHSIYNEDLQEEISKLRLNPLITKFPITTSNRASIVSQSVQLKGLKDTLRHFNRLDLPALHLNEVNLNKQLNSKRSPRLFKYMEARPSPGRQKSLFMQKKFKPDQLEAIVMQAKKRSIRPVSINPIAERSMEKDTGSFNSKSMLDQLSPEPSKIDSRQISPTMTRGVNAHSSSPISEKNIREKITKSLYPINIR